MSNLSDQSCPFCLIASLNPADPANTSFHPETPHLLRKTSTTLTFLDIMPLAPLHTLIIPRHHYLRIEDIPTADLATLIQEVQVVTRCLHLLSKTTATDTREPRIDYNVVCNNGPSSGQVVPHVHFHVVPRTRGLEDGGRVTGWEKSWRMFAKGNRDDLDLRDVEELVEKVKVELERLGKGVQTEKAKL